MSMKEIDQSRRAKNAARLTRRQFLRGGLIVVGGAVLHACAPEAATDGAPSATEATGGELGELVPELEVVELQSTAWEETWRQLSPELEKLGLQVNVQIVAPTSWIDKAINEHDYGAFTGTAWGLNGDRFDPNWVLTELLHSKRAEPGGRNLAQYSNPEFDAIVEAQAKELDPEARRELIHQAQEIFAEDNPWYSMYFLNDVLAYNSDRWEGFIPVFGGGITRWNNLFSYLSIRSKTDETVFKVSNDHEGNSTNPFIASGGSFNTDTMRWVYDTLARLDTENEVVPWAAESWDWADDTTLDLTLRSDMNFHDGEQVTAEDVEFTVNYAIEHQFPQWLGVVENLESVEATGDLTVRFTLREAFAPFVSSSLPFIFIAPKHIWEEVDNPNEFENPDPVGSGPWTFGHWRKNESWRFNRNPEHWNPPAIDVLVAIIPETETVLAQMESGELDALGVSMRGDEQIERMEALDFVTVERVPNSSTYTVIPDNSERPGSDPEFRRAIHYALPKERLLEVISGSGGGLTGGSTWLHPESPWYNDDLPGYEFNIERARQVLADAGYGWDEEGRLHYPPA